MNDGLVSVFDGLVSVSPDITCQVTQKECWTCFGESVGGRKDIRRCMMGRGSVTMRTHQERRVCILLPNKQQLDRPVRVRTLSEWLFCDI